MIKIRRHNKKLGKQTIVFNMGPAVNCPSKDLNLCNLGNKCYALKSEKMYKSVIPARQQQKKYWLNTDIDTIIKDIKEYIKNKPLIKYFRFNESGDFFTKNCILKVFKIAKNIPQITFYLYTHRIDLKGYFDKNKPKNLIINGSGFMVDNNFKVITKEYLKNISRYNITDSICCGSCIDCNLCKKIGKKTIFVMLH